MQFRFWYDTPYFSQTSKGMVYKSRSCVDENMFVKLWRRFIKRNKSFPAGCAWLKDDLQNDTAKYRQLKTYKRDSCMITGAETLSEFHCSTRQDWPGICLIHEYINCVANATVSCWLQFGDTEICHHRSACTDIGTALQDSPQVRKDPTASSTWLIANIKSSHGHTFPFRGIAEKFCFVSFLVRGFHNLQI